MHRRYVFVAVLAGASLSLSAADPQYSRTRELPALKMTFEELDAALAKAYNLLGSANSQASNKDQARETLTLRSGPDEIEIQGHAFPPDVRLPKVAFRASYSYSLPDAPVSTLRLSLDDAFRQITVSGTAADQVEAICSSLERDLSAHAVAFGGSLFRGMVGYLLATVLMTSFIISGTYCIAERRWRALGMPLFSLLGFALLLALPFDELLAGFAVYKGDSSLLVRFAPQISFISLLVSIVAIPLSYLLPRWIDRRRARQA